MYLLKILLVFFFEPGVFGRWPSLGDASEINIVDDLSPSLIENSVVWLANEEWPHGIVPWVACEKKGK